ncbi:glycosyltransferase family 2 protein [Algoriphagus sp. PAP.12]|uniref:glycosyltransferase family 2 protein n=1 Tax=Algoriphagus sp. PAP.12 TaxID=2996678 RepID=UPI00227A9611|nr:glycosyltransferase family A protein [Algoriphagus sp. PAP.12]
MVTIEIKKSLGIKFSVIIPFFNGANTLDRAIQSVLSQKYPDWELILVNDGSTDQSEQISQYYMSNPKVSYFYQENIGVSAARNLGASNAIGEWLIFLDSDDEFENSLFDSLMNSNSQDQEVLVWGFDWVFPNGESKSFVQNDEKYIPFLSGTFTIKREVFDSLHGYDENLRFGENTELFHRLNLASLILKKIPIIGLTYYDSTNGGSKNLQNVIDSNLLILNKHKQTLPNHTKHLYHQIIGVNQLRFRKFSQARKHLWIAYRLKPYKLSTLLRLLISLSPLISSKIYLDSVK